MAGEGHRLEGRVALVTGAASGIGWATAARLADDGARVLLTDRDAARLDEARATLEAQDAARSARLLSHPLDVTSEDDWTAAVAVALERCGRLDVLVNNAGVAASAPLAETTLAAWRQLMAVNLEGVFLGLRAAADALARDGGGAVVNVASASGHRALAGAAAYCTSKAALLMLTRAAALELAPRGVRVNSVSPAGVATPLWTTQAWWPKHVERAGSESAAYAALSADTPLKRFAQPSEVAELIAWLASDAGAYVTGSDFAIDGGYAA
jgi:NAD(P)-dependent dehydrogenase (short-subunit alcohol dehydrogenase family)